MRSLQTVEGDKVEEVEGPPDSSNQGNTFRAPAALRRVTVNVTVMCRSIVTLEPTIPGVMKS